MFVFFLSRTMLNMCILHPPTLEKYSQTFLKNDIFDPPSHFFPNPSKTPQNHSPHVPNPIKKYPQHHQKMSKKVTRAHRESNRVPPDSKSEAQPTRLIWHQNIVFLKKRIPSKIWGEVPPCPQGLIPPEK